MHTNKYLEKIAEYGTNDDPERLRKSLGLGYGLAGVAIGAGFNAPQQVASQRNLAKISRDARLGTLPSSIAQMEDIDIPRLQQAHEAAVGEADKGATWRKAQRFLDHDVAVAKSKLDNAIAHKESLKAQLHEVTNSDSFKTLERELARVNSKRYAAKTMALQGLKLGIPGFVIGSGMGMVGDAWRKDLNKQAEHPSDDVATTTLINKITNPISWAAKIDLAGNTSTRVAALALNTLAREASKSDEYHNIPGPIQHRV